MCHSNTLCNTQNGLARFYEKKTAVMQKNSYTLYKCVHLFTFPLGCPGFFRGMDILTSRGFARRHLATAPWRKIHTWKFACWNNNLYIKNAFLTLIWTVVVFEYPKDVERSIANLMLLSSKRYLICSASPESSFVLCIKNLQVSIQLHRICTTRKFYL